MSGSDKKPPPPEKQFLSRDNKTRQVNMPGNEEMEKDMFPTLPLMLEFLCKGCSTGKITQVQKLRKLVFSEETMRI